MRVFVFVLLCLASFRATRLITSDEWPPSEWFREKIAQRFGPYSSWVTLFTCPWCLGAWFSIALTTLTQLFIYDFFTDKVLNKPAFLGLIIGAVAAVVGYLGTYDER